MPRWAVRVEGVNMGATLLDTQDLATLRGGGLCLLRLPDEVAKVLRTAYGDTAVREIYTGASQGLFEVEAPDGAKIESTVRDAVASGFGAAGLPSRHMSIVVDAARSGKADELDDASIQRATAANRFRQYQAASLPIPDAAPGGKAPCAIDGVRPAAAGIRVPVDVADTAALHEEDADTAASAEIRVSASVAARRKYGQKAKRAFFRQEIGSPAGDFDVAESLRDIVVKPPRDLPHMLTNKMAVVYADGNGFTKIRAALAKAKGGEAAALSAFSGHLKARRGELLASVIKDFRAGARAEGDQASARVWLRARRRGEQVDLLRLETLLWGGDELMIVVPAWAMWEVVGSMTRAMAGWEIDGHALTHAVGVLCCQHKTPIRQAKMVAEKLADSAKKALKNPDRAANVCQIQIQESVEAPEGDLEKLRKPLYGTRGGPDKAFTIEADAWDETTREMRAIREALPRSQLYRLIREQVRAGHTEDDIAAALESLIRDNGYPLKLEDFRSKRLPGAQGGLGLVLPLLAEYWDYVDPFGDSQ